MGGQGAQIRPISDTYVKPFAEAYNQQNQQLGQAMAASNAWQTPQQKGVANAQASKIAGALLGRQANATAATSDFGGLNQGQSAASFGNQQQALANQLQRAANGQGPSLATQTIGQGVAASLAAQNAAAASARGTNYGATLKRAADNAMATQAQGAIAAGAQRMQEQQAAQQALGAVLGQAREQDIGLATTGAQMGLQNAQFNAANRQAVDLANQGAANQFALQQAGWNEQTQLANQAAQNTANLTNAAATNQQLQFNAQTALAAQQERSNEQAKLMALQQQGLSNQWGALSDWLNMNTQIGQYNAGAEDRSDAATRQQIGQIGTAALAMAMLSDERQKTEIRTPGTKEIGEFLSAARPHAYRYKDTTMSGAAEGEHFSPMAQELEKTSLGKAMVETTPAGVKMVNYQRGLGALLASAANLHDRISKLERKR